MNTTKQRRLEANGWKFGDSSEFLNLSREESILIRSILEKANTKKSTSKRSKG